MPPAIPLRVRIPIEYGVAMAVGAAVAWLYAEFAGAAFLLALALGLSMLLGFWVLTQVSPKTRGRGFHVLTAAALAVTLFVVLKLA